MSFAAVDTNRRFTPEFAAYTKATLVNRFKAYGGDMGITTHGNRDRVSFDTFMKAIQKDQVINQKYSRDIPNYEIQSSGINAKLNGNYEFENKKMSIVERAYELGMIGYDGVLIPSFMEKA
ncbi:MAG: hypothetical protein WDZ91_08310 [Paenibacillaceae bacterium]